MASNQRSKVNSFSVHLMEKRFDEQFDKVDKSLSGLAAVINNIDARTAVLENSFQMIKQMIARRGWLIMTKDDDGNSVLKDELLRQDNEKDLPIYGVDGNIRSKKY